jgi:hypothetical protein
MHTRSTLQDSTPRVIAALERLGGQHQEELRVSDQGMLRVRRSGSVLHITKPYCVGMIQKWTGLCKLKYKDASPR